MKTKKKTIMIIGISAVSLLAVIFLVFYLLYFVYQIPLFDRSGWHETKRGTVQYWDYFGKPLTLWLDIDGKKYYFDPESGDMRVGWLDTGDCRYYLDMDGAMHTGGWLELAGNRYFFDETGAMHTGWLETEKGRYYLSEQGAMCTGWLDMPEGRYYLSETGIMNTGWVETREGRFYLNKQGLLQTNWIETENGWHYLEDDGSVCTGWQTIDGMKYYFNDSGVMETGWITCTDGRYYLYEDGSFAAGFVEIGGIERYFTVSGEYIPLVNLWNAVPDDYALNLVDLEGYQVDASCRDMLSNMMKACREAGHTCVLDSTYRGISTQQYLWDNRYNNYIARGIRPEEANRLTCQVVAYPGTSEHHLGLAIDIVGTDAMYDWLREHSWEYGFIVRYPEDKIDVTGIIYEPWHIRYVGKELAKAVCESGLCLEEYLQMLKTQ